MDPGSPAVVDKPFPQRDPDFDLRAPGVDALGTLLANGDERGLPLAREHFEAAVQANPDQGEAAGWLAALAIAAGDTTAAARWLRTLSGRGTPGSGIAGRALVGSELARWRGGRQPPEASAALGVARGLLDSALVLAPHDPDLLEAYAASWLGEPQSGRRGIDAATQALAGRPRSPALLGTLALLSLQSGQLPTALALLSRIGPTPSIVAAGPWPGGFPWREWVITGALHAGVDGVATLTKSGSYAAADSLWRTLQPLDVPWTHRVLARVREQIREQAVQDSVGTAEARKFIPHGRRKGKPN